MLLEFNLQHEIIVNTLGQIEQRLQGAGENAMLKEIGEHLTNTTQERFRTSTAPDGSRWQENSPVTLLNILGKQHYKKDGSLNRRGQHRLNSKKPLIGARQESGTLQDSIHYQLGNGEVFVGSNMEYAPMMHFGGKKSQFPHLWGDIPARPFLGLSLADEEEIIEIVKEHILP